MTGDDSLSVSESHRLRKRAYSACSAGSAALNSIPLQHSRTFGGGGQGQVSVTHSRSLGAMTASRSLGLTGGVTESVPIINDFGAEADDIANAISSDPEDVAEEDKLAV